MCACVTSDQCQQVTSQQEEGSPLEGQELEALTVDRSTAVLTRKNNSAEFGAILAHISKTNTSHCEQ